MERASSPPSNLSMDVLTIQSSITEADKPGSPFLKLPLELRQMIYTMVLLPDTQPRCSWPKESYKQLTTYLSPPTHKDSILWADRFLREDKLRRITPAGLLLANRQISAEFQDILATEKKKGRNATTWKLECTVFNDLKHVLVWTALPCAFELVTHVEIRYLVLNPSGWGVHGNHPRGGTWITHFLVQFLSRGPHFDGISIDSRGQGLRIPIDLTFDIVDPIILHPSALPDVVKSSVSKKEYYESIYEYVCVMLRRSARQLAMQRPIGSLTVRLGGKSRSFVVNERFQNDYQ
ncbi:hypothetical protein MMC25_006337 [Agyrium rufum]|nr:hypothetical protein [Agyrium rufum]